MKRRFMVDNRGFSLVELLIVMLMLGIVTMAILGLYQSTQRSATTQDQVVEMQQNLRVGVDEIARDIRMAGFMLAGDAFSTAAANTLTLQTANVSGRMARVVTGFNSSTSANVDVIVAFSEMVDFFESGGSGDWVRIIRPPNQTEPLADTFQVASKSRTDRRLTLNNFSADAVLYQPGDIIVRVPSSTATLPRTITYSLAPDPDDPAITNLVRAADDGPQVVARNITGLAFSYLLDDDTESSTPANLSTIRGARVTLTSLVVTPSLQGGPPVTKTRSLTSTIALRNR
jgi:prepilin-type N-terminal cleavage/methylation domain-containing protein